MINKYKFFLAGFLVLALVLTVFSFVAKASIGTVIFDPGLNISRFAPYKIKAEISDNPVSASVEISGVNGNVVASTTCWNYYADGRCGSEPGSKNMTFNSDSGLWESTNVYPDDIYPEIFFSPSEITLYYTPQNIIFNRSNYQILKFNNPFEMVDGMSFFIEFNTVPQSTNNSADLQVYLVSKDKDITFFNSDWRSDPGVALVGTINRNQSPHHTHTSNSSHHLVALSTDLDGKISGLDVSGDFWVILYNNSPNNNRGWSLRYQTICDAEIGGYWYQGNQSNWATSLQAGCPDAHIHVARTLTENNTTVRDGVKSIVTATYGDNSIATSSQFFYFTPLVNLAPNSTSFTSPVVGNVYSEGPISVSWNPATDPNNDPLVYSIYLLDSEGLATSTLLSSTTTTNFSWDISSLDNGVYSLKGVITEDIPTDPLSTDFFLGGNFTIDKEVTVYSLSDINVASNNTSATLAKTGDVITLSFSASGPIDPLVIIYSGDTQIDSGRIDIASSTNNFTITYTVQDLDDDGLISFEISASNLDKAYNDTTNSSFVVVDTTPPTAVLASPVAGTYSAPQSVSLSSSGADSIRYTIDNSDPGCFVGLLYESAITVSVPTTIKTIACDLSGNNSGVSSFVYGFQYTLTYTAGLGGSISGISPQSIDHGLNGSIVTAVPDTGYSFVDWSDGVLTPSRTDTNISQNITVTANFAINTYTLTFDSDGGTVVNSITQDYNTAVISPTNPTKTGYTFSGWDPALPINMPASNQTHTAQWAINQYTLTYNSGIGGSVIGTSPQTVNYGSDGSSVTATPDLGYHFVSWSDGNTDSSRTDNGITNNITVTANFALNDMVTLNYEAGVGGIIIGSSTQVFASGLSGTEVIASSSPGYTFSEWSDSSAVNPRQDTSVTTDIFVTAIFTPNNYILTFEAQGGVVGVSTTTVTFNSSVGTLPTPTRAGYTFSGWNSQSNGEGTPYTDSTVYQVSADSTIFAQWSINQYTLTFDSDGGTVVNSITQDYNTAVISPTNPTKTGYTFSGWDPALPANMPASNQTHTAQWAPNNYTLTFNPQEGIVSPLNKSVTFNSEVGSLPTPTKNGYTFNGWYTTPGDGIQYLSTTTYQTAGNLTLYAQWTANNYLIAFNTQGGTSVSSISVTYNSEIGSLPVSSRTGYTFSGWYTEANGLGESYVNTTNYLLTESLVLIANWTPSQFVLTFDSDGGTAVNSITQDYNTAVVSPANPTKTGYTFSGWDPALPTNMPASNQTHTAQWAINQYTLTYLADANGGITGDESQTVNYGSSGTSIIAVPAKGFEFYRWSDNSTANPRTDTNVNTNISATAEFRLISVISNAFAPSPAIGDGQVDVTILMSGTGSLGRVDDEGVNYLSYVGSRANFSTLVSSSNNLADYWLTINSLDLNDKLLNFTIESGQNSFQLALGQRILIDLDGDGVEDIQVKFIDLLVNRTELTITSVLKEQAINPPVSGVSTLDRESIIQEARNSFVSKSVALSNRLSGRILLQVEKHGQAWYLNPLNQARYYLGRPADSFAIMRNFGLGVSEKNFNEFNQKGAPARLSGRIILRVEANGEAYYINPVNLQMHYLGRPADAFVIMRELSLGISNTDLDQLLVGEIN